MGRPPITQAVMDDVFHALAAGETCRAIARRLGVSRGTVGTIAHGEHPHQRVEDVPGEEKVPTPSGPYVWCPACRAKVQMPCLACWLRARR